MPVSFQPAKHQANAFPSQPQWAQENSTARILQGMQRDQFTTAGEIFQSSVNQNDGPNIIPYRNGFVDTVVQCYSDHNALVIRPDDVWLAILTQFNFFVNGNHDVDQLRQRFVGHKDKKALQINSMGDRYNVDFGLMSRRMTKCIEENIVDPTLREWILPDFSTTTITDTTVSSVIMMATLKGYFTYKYKLGCGLPRVTLEGEQKDWENILARLEKLKEFGEETTAWYHLLLPVISRFVVAFDTPDAEENLKFWQKVAHYEGGGSGPTWISGWINAFCVFSNKGKWIGLPIDQVSLPFDSISAPSVGASSKRRSRLTLDGVTYHRTETLDVPCGFAQVDVKLDDNGLEFDTVLTAGLVGAQVCDSGDKTLSQDGKRDSARPIAAWWIALKGEPKDFKYV